MVKNIVMMRIISFLNPSLFNGNVFHPIKFYAFQNRIEKRKLK
jgi:hypothetical protein